MNLYGKRGVHSNIFHSNHIHLELSFMSFVNPAQAVFGPLLFILEEIPDLSQQLEEKSKTAAAVFSLVEPLLGKGHTLWMDNFNNAPALAKKTEMYEN
jgi:hypothetical protein